MSFNPVLPSTDYSTLTAEQIIAHRKKIAEETRRLDEALKQKMEEQRASFVQNVAEQINALEILPADFIDSIKQAFKIDGGSYYYPKEVFDTIPKDKLDDWFSQFNELKNEYIRSQKTPFFKLPKRTVAGISDTKFSTIYFEDIKGGEKGIQAIAEKIAPTRKEALTKLFENLNPEDEKVKTALDMLYPTPAPNKKK